MERMEEALAKPGPSRERPGPSMENLGFSTGGFEIDMRMDCNVLESSFTEDMFNRFQEQVMSNSMIDTNDVDLEEDNCNEEVKKNEKEKPSQLVKQNCKSNIDSSAVSSVKLNGKSNIDSSDVSSRLVKKKSLRLKSPGGKRGTSSCEKKQKDFQPPKLKDPNRDIFCWKCHKFGEDVIPCSTCPRVYHLKCSLLPENAPEEWICTECDDISSAEKFARTSPVLKRLTPNDLYCHLLFVIKRMRQHEGSCHFEHPVDLIEYPDYQDYIVRPMCLTLLEENTNDFKYTNCQAFLADVKWMVHNSYVFNTVHSELTGYAKAMFRNASHDCEEIINCPDCYLHANTLEDEWFIEPCERPHILAWARLRGYPYWPCKVMSFPGSKTADVRFFGAHNKSVVPVEQCYLYSKKTPSKQKKSPDLIAAIEESYAHVKKLELTFGVFCFAPVKVALDPKDECEQRRFLLPNYKEDVLQSTNASRNSETKKEECGVNIIVPRSLQRSNQR